MLPFFSIITTVFKKEKEIQFFLKSLLNQNYTGKWEVVIFDDKSPDNSLNIINSFKDSYVKKDIGLVVIHNEKNLGQCFCRNEGIKRAKGDILIIIDSDCIMDINYLSNFAILYGYEDCDVVIGPINIETNGRDVQEVIAECRNLRIAQNNAKLQDPFNKRSFLNCVTRNFSIKKSFITEDLFDEAFSHIATDPSTGFGWDDIEMGFRLYKRGARIKYNESVYTVHMSHPPSIENESSIPLRSLKNFRRMYEKHPEMKDIVRWWTMDTYKKIIQWVQANKHDLPTNEDYIFLQNHFKKDIPYIYEPATKRRLRILSYIWHVPHQYELHKLPHDFTLIGNIGTSHCYKWSYSQRPFPFNDTMKQLHEININEYDLAIFHFDENCLNPENTNGVISQNWGLDFKYFIEKITAIPKIGICHGTPQFYGAYTPNYNKNDLLEVNETARQAMVQYIGDNLVICNSHQAEREWGFKNSKVIWHGFDPAEFPRSNYTKKVMGLTDMIGRPHYRGLIVLNKVNSCLPPELKVNGIQTPEPLNYKTRNNNDYAFSKYRNYIDSIREYSIYFNPTIRSPMPRSRTEAMMCGLVTVSYKSHDVEMFIKNGINGFYSENLKELADFIIFLSENDSVFKRISSESYQTAIDIFNNDRYLHDWQETIFRIV